MSDIRSKIKSLFENILLKEESLTPLTFVHTCPDGTVFNVEVIYDAEGKEIFKISDKDKNPVETFGITDVEKVSNPGIPVDKKKMILDDYTKNQKGKQTTVTAGEAVPAQPVASQPAAETTVAENKEVIGKFQQEYGKEKGNQVYYATANKQDRDPETFKTEAVHDLDTGNVEVQADDHTDDQRQEVAINEKEKESAAIEKETDETEEIPVEKVDKIKEFIKNTPNLDDTAFHAFVEKLGIDPHEAEESVYRYVQELTAFADLIKNKKGEIENPIEGGVGDNLSQEDVDQEELAMGMKVEMEHIAKNDKISEEIKAAIAKDIAMDHLKEIPDYYTRLLAMELEAKEELGLNTDEEGSDSEIETDEDSDDVESEETEENPEKEEAIQKVGFNIISEGVDVGGKSIREIAKTIVENWSIEEWNEYKKTING